MKFITVILIIASVSAVVVTADDKIDSKLPSDKTAKSQRSIEALLETLTKLVQGVIDGDKFVLDVLHLPKDIELSDIQDTELNRLLTILNDINKKL